MKQHYDYLIVGAGLFGCVCADILTKNGYSVLVIDKLPHIGGTCYTQDVNGIHVHKYGAHIFRTNSDEVFHYFSQFCQLNNFINSPIAIYHGKAYNLPFNMNTFTRVWPISTPQEAKAVIDQEIKKYGRENPKNLEEYAINLIGKTLYDMFICEYTEKQWGRKCCDLPSSIIRRIPLRFTYDNNYYYAKYQGIPIGGYTAIFQKMLKNSDVLLETDFNKARKEWANKADKIIYTGPIDEYFDYQFGELEYRGLKFEEKRFNKESFQGNAVFNYNDKSVDYTRTIEHKYFENLKTPFTIVSFEYPSIWKKGDYPFYPINDERNSAILKKYLDLSVKESKTIFGGRLGSYQYFDMSDTIESAVKLCSSLLKG